MSKNDRWTRMSELADIDLQKFRAQMAAYEAELNAAQQQFKSLAEYYQQSADELAKPSDYQSITSILRRKDFLGSLQVAMEQQDKFIHSKQSQVEQTRQQVVKLFQKKESYLILAKARQLEEQKTADKKETDFLDDLVNQTDRNSDDTDD